MKSLKIGLIVTGMCISSFAMDDNAEKVFISKESVKRALKLYNSSTIQNNSLFNCEKLNDEIVVEGEGDLEINHFDFETNPRIKKENYNKNNYLAAIKYQAQKKVEFSYVEELRGESFILKSLGNNHTTFQVPLSKDGQIKDKEEARRLALEYISSDDFQESMAEQTKHVKKQNAEKCKYLNRFLIRQLRNANALGAGVTIDMTKLFFEVNKKITDPSAFIHIGIGQTMDELKAELNTCQAKLDEAKEAVNQSREDTIRRIEDVIKGLGDKSIEKAR